jgi:hypothetical protein
MQVSLFAWSLTLKMEVIYSSETSVDFHRTTRRYMPGDILYSHNYEDFKSNQLHYTGGAKVGIQFYYEKKQNNFIKSQEG